MYKYTRKGNEAQQRNAVGVTVQSVQRKKWKNTKEKYGCKNR